MFITVYYCLILFNTVHCCLLLFIAVFICAVTFSHHQDNIFNTMQLQTLYGFHMSLFERNVVLLSTTYLCDGLFDYFL